MKANFKLYNVHVVWTQTWSNACEDGRADDSCRWFSSKST